MAEPAKPDDPKPLEIVACGQPLPGHEIRIVDEAGHELGERQEGRLEFRGPSTTRGYFQNETKTRELFTTAGSTAATAHTWQEGRLYHRTYQGHHHPRGASSLSARDRRSRGRDSRDAQGRRSRIQRDRSSSGTERVVVLAETREPTRRRAALQARAHEVTTDIAGTPPDEVVLAPPRTVPKTSSGKIRRSAAKELYESGHIGPTRRPLWWQLLRLAFSGVGPQIRRLGRLTGEVLYAAWWWLVLGRCVFVGIACYSRPAAPDLAVVRPQVGWSRYARGDGDFNLGHRHRTHSPRRAMLVFNHSSYMDALVLAAVLPGEPAIVAKRELSEQRIAGSLLRRLGIPFVERYDVSGSLADAEALIAFARKGRILVFFPEGTFTRRAGLSGFYLGAFKIAAEAGLPVLPGTIRGTRSLLRSDQWFPRRAAVSVEIGEPVMPSGTDFGSVVRLRDEVRKSVFSRCGEPDLEELVKPVLEAFEPKAVLPSRSTRVIDNLSPVVLRKGRHDFILHSFILSGVTGGEVERLNPANPRLARDLPGRLGGQMGALGR